MPDTFLYLAVVLKLACPSCRKGYVLDWDTFQMVVLAEAKWLMMNPGPPDIVAVHLAGHATVVRKLFPMVPFNAFEVIDEEAEEAKRRMQQAKKRK